MGKGLVRAIVFPALLAVVFGAACDKSKDNSQGQQGAPPFGPGGPGGPPSEIGKIMIQLAKGPQSLNETIGRELKTDPPPWDEIQPQAKQYAELAASLSKYDPPRGSKESWAKQTAAYSEKATELERAADTKDKDKALAAHAALGKSCMGCHREHKRGPGGPGGFRPPGDPGGPPRPPQS